ncbi:putative S-adenosyl-L-methionine-dependent methyltransferase [Thiomonas arsenitoxydans]|uniref:S-adenosyl-L-methionine-dependent methyltransferase n=1 Tax=Thiomonas arsenitoxydans (strain DSM 22701 / CIP 110005 / 3As) TaxID=426114 RepID=D6CPH2_THIA3|nr:SAM-dependent methyltransferase [Thiomonas arsenitoxydans]CAZ87902.1 putative S-adenosyl-L-methionine-dependent methyltransferase [Thiomonas arsenitoxydans]CQR26568.1 putative S-adenosyl-L-methionine-dependent methyltransferase [Thiomonas arsenitoxydans]CQR27314.1 putative S-adenosyl-L-methionine-dependent methyltransferase [Thiomonas arsenitoxydans]CQR31320.1 putative S-adenosyl-L-methionine-dependent methyltransferase [Thiomonas arsenitoxydans]CQR31339.1 putative S-adenosyl-L-methionine-d
MARKPTFPQPTLSEEDGVRHLHLGTPWIQGSMRIARPNDLELEYVQRMMAWMLLAPDAAWRGGTAVQLGLGAAAITKFMLKRLRLPCVAVELNPGVILAAHRWFALPEPGGKLQVLCADAGAYAADPAHAGSAAVLHVDMYDEQAAAPALESAEFYAACRQLLGEQGVMAVNLFSGPGHVRVLERNLQRIVAAFNQPGDSVWQLPPNRDGNLIAIALRDATQARLPTRAQLLERADAVAERTGGLPARRWARLLKRLHPAR